MTEIDPPQKTWQRYIPAVHDSDERQRLSRRDGTSVAFTADSVRLYSEDNSAFIELTKRELLALLTDIYGTSEGGS
jgi:hypothetical protein